LIESHLQPGKLWVSKQLNIEPPLVRVKMIPPVLAQGCT
jgi:hypothetical protein